MKPPLNSRVSSSVPPSLLCPSVCVDRCVIFPIFFLNTSNTAQQVSGHQEWEGNKPGMALHPCPYLDISSSSMCCLLAGWCINNVFFMLFSDQFCNAPMRLPAAHHPSAESDTAAFCPPRRKLITTTTSLLYQRTISSQASSAFRH
jgi:hypothetical protein